MLFPADTDYPAEPRRCCGLHISLVIAFFSLMCLVALAATAFATGGVGLLANPLGWSTTPAGPAVPPPPMNDTLRYLHFPKCASSFAEVVYSFSCPTLRPTDTQPTVKGYVKGDPYLLKTSVSFVKFENVSSVCHRYHCADPSRIGHCISSDYRHAPLRSSAEAKQAAAMFRDPRQRVLSAFYYGYHLPPGRSEQVRNFVRNKAFLSQSEEKRLDMYTRLPGIKGTMARMLAGYLPAAPRRLTRSEMRLALFRLSKLRYVGLYERFHQSVCLFYCIFGDRVKSQLEPTLFRPGPHHNNTAQAAYDTAILDRVGFKDIYDNVIYRTAQTRFEQLLTAHNCCMD